MTMKKTETQSPAGRGLAEVSQDAIEARALELAATHGRSLMNAEDLELATKQILGVAKTTAATHPSLKAKRKV